VGGVDFTTVARPVVSIARTSPARARRPWRSGRCITQRLASRPRITLRSTAVILADGTFRETSIITVVVVRVVVAIAP
jgi:hypothetical protein